MPRAVHSDDDLLAMIRQAEARDAMLASVAEVDDDEPERDGDTCRHCGEPALEFEECLACGELGCLPRDDWRPGWADPCLARCSRCGMLFHADCGGVNDVGNPLCGVCGPALDPMDL